MTSFIWGCLVGFILKIWQSKKPYWFAVWMMILCFAGVYVATDAELAKHFKSHSVECELTRQWSKHGASYEDFLECPDNAIEQGSEL